MAEEGNLARLHHGVKVFGSAIVRVAPDLASVVVGGSRIEPKPETAFAKAREGAQSVNAYLHKAGNKDFGSSRLSLTQEFRYTVSGRYEGHTYREPAPVDDAGEPGAIDPSAITVGAAVNVLYSIEEQG